LQAGSVQDFFTGGFAIVCLQRLQVYTFGVNSAIAKFDDETGVGVGVFGMQYMGRECHDEQAEHEYWKKFVMCEWCCFHNVTFLER
jgi:hypothetical protein